MAAIGVNWKDIWAPVWKTVWQQSFPVVTPRITGLPTWYYAPGNIPLDAPAWLTRELMSVSRASYGAAPIIQFQVQYAEPAKPRDGMVVLADGSTWNPGSGAGIYARIGGAWVQL